MMDQGQAETSHYAGLSVYWAYTSATEAWWEGGIGQSAKC